MNGNPWIRFKSGLWQGVQGKEEGRGVRCGEWMAGCVDHVKIYQLFSILYKSLKDIYIEGFLFQPVKINFDE
jgi:hypothetical protein